MHKRILSLVLALALVVSLLAGCGGKKAPVEEQPKDTASAPAVTDKTETPAEPVVYVDPYAEIEDYDELSGAIYEDVLEGTSGRVVTSKTAAGTEIYNSYSDYVDAVDGCDVNLTIDTAIQRMAEQTLAQGIEKYDEEREIFQFHRPDEH